MCQRILKGKIHSSYYCLDQYFHRKIPRLYSWSWLSYFFFFYPHSCFLLWLSLQKDYTYLPYQIVDLVAVFLICMLFYVFFFWFGLTLALQQSNLINAHRPRKLGRYLDYGKYFRTLIGKTDIIVLILISVQSNDCSKG